MQESNITLLRQATNKRSPFKKKPKKKVIHSFLENNSARHEIKYVLIFLN